MSLQTAATSVSLVLAPLDVLFFRDGRPFGAAGQAQSLLMPLPQTLSGAISTALLESHDAPMTDLGKLVQSGLPFELPQPLNAGHACCAPDSPLKLDREHLVLEEFDLQVDPWNAFPSLAQQLAQWVTDDVPFQQDFAARLVILDDDQFTHFVRHGTEVVARIGLDYETKTVRTGALFYQEFLPAETILYSLVLASPARDGSDQSAADILRLLQSSLPDVLQFGGDETTGKGFCHVHFAS